MRGKAFPSANMAPPPPHGYNPAMTTAAADTADWAAQTEARLLDAALPLVGRFGWTSRLVAAAALAAGLALADAELLLPRGARDLAALLSARHDQAALAALASVDVSTLKIRERIARAVQARTEAAMADEPAVRRLAGFFALPPNAALGARLSWTSADLLWRWAGDVSTDENHYSKRAILAGLLTSTLLMRLSGGPGPAEAHLNTGIEAVMAYETFKRRFSGRDLAGQAAALLGRLRYGAAPPAG